MKRIHLAVIVLAATATLDAVQSPPPRDWIDPATGHRVVRLTDDAGGQTLYFHDNAFSPDGDKLMFTPDKKWVIFTGQFAQGQRHVYAVQIAK